MQEHNTRVAHKTRQTQASHLVILTGSQNPRPILGKPRCSSTGFSKPREKHILDPRLDKSKVNP